MMADSTDAVDALANLAIRKRTLKPLGYFTAGEKGRRAKAGPCSIVV